MSYEAPAPFSWRFCPVCSQPLDLAHDGESVRPHCAVCRRFYYRNPVPATCCIVAREDGALLFTRRAFDPCKGAWTLPGGYMELNETAEDSAVRELREETGLAARRLRLLGVSTTPSAASGSILVLGYVVEEWTGTLRPGSDAVDVRFFGRMERPQMPFRVHIELLGLYDAAVASPR